MKTEFSAGTWTVDRCFNSVDIDNGRYSFICHPAPTNIKQLKEVEANARLIAAAPDLLAALERVEMEMIDYGRTSFNHVGMVLAVKEAIAKATEG